MGDYDTTLLSSAPNETSTLAINRISQFFHFLFSYDFNRDGRNGARLKCPFDFTFECRFVRLEWKWGAWVALRCELSTFWRLLGRWN
jgi:hypothetical protein